MLGPAPAPMALLRGRHRKHLLIKAHVGGASLNDARALLVRLAATQSRPRISIDVDPVSLL